MNDAEQPLIVPIAHYVGQVYDADGSGPTYHLRGGWGIVEITELERAVWAVAHGIPEQLADGRRWTRQALTEALSPDINPDAVITDLLARDVLAEVTPGTPQAVEFASKYRLVPLQIGLGNSREEPWVWRIGIGNNVLVTTTSTVFHIWKWGHLYKTLWDACKSLAATREENANRPAEERSADAILDDVLQSLHVLLTPSCAYLDVPFEWGSA